ncbi:uncharacterized protein [Trachinotus anak]|uniref:uncharacterized protein n=1 Tax=Trachinotus anak TaxID=443729 RepID=UPI0039F19DE4
MWYHRGWDVTQIAPVHLCEVAEQSLAESQAALDPASTPLPQSDHLPQTPPPTPSPIESPSCETYSVPWHKMPPNLMVPLGEKKRAPPKERREMVRIIIDDLLSKEPGRPGRAKLRGIAKQIVEQYPCSFQDRELNGTNVIGTGYDALFIQLENRVENARRPSLICSEKRPAEDVMRKKSRNSDRYGCVEWQPAVEGGPELHSKQDELKSAFKTHHLQESTVRKLMADTYSIQRETINKSKQSWQRKYPEKEQASKTSLTQKG